jgi:hypothetical protein
VIRAFSQAIALPVENMFLQVVSDLPFTLRVILAVIGARGIKLRPTAIVMRGCDGPTERILRIGTNVPGGMGNAIVSDDAFPLEHH